MKFLLVKSVFCPNDRYFEITTDSIVRINIFIKLLQDICQIEADVLYIGWINKYTSSFESFISLLESPFFSIYKELWVLNYGKYKIYNNMIDFVNKNNEYEYIIYLDHDIYFDFNTIDLYSSLHLLKNYQHKLGMIAFNQLIDNRHRTDIYEDVSIVNIENDKHITLMRSYLPGSIASGGFMMFTDVLVNMDHFDTTSVYGLDDYHLAKNLLDKNYVNVVIGNVYVVHPFDDNKEYTVWKKNQILKLINNNCNSYYQQIQQTINFWNNTS